MAFSFRQKKVLAIIPHITGFLSIIGSVLILYDILSDARRKLKRMYYRILFAFSCFDCVTSVWIGLSTWPIPEGTPGVYDPRGTTETCTAQGFFIQLSVISPLYNSMLAVYYLLLIRHNLTEEQISRRYEALMHTYAVTLGLGVTFAGLGLGLYNNAVLWCWIAPYPLNCQGSDGKAGPIGCERGYNAWIYRWAFFYGPIWFTIVLITVIMFLLCDSVRRDEARSIAYDKQDRLNKRRVSDIEKQELAYLRTKFERSTRMFWQAFWYCAAFYAAWTAATINRLVQLITGNTYFALMVLHATFAPAQGIFNFLVYSRGPCVA